MNVNELKVYCRVKRRRGGREVKGEKEEGRNKNEVLTESLIVSLLPGKFLLLYNKIVRLPRLKIIQ